MHNADSRIGTFFFFFFKIFFFAVVAPLRSSKDIHSDQGRVVHAATWLFLAMVCTLEAHVTRHAHARPFNYLRIHSYIQEKVTKAMVQGAGAVPPIFRSFFFSPEFVKDIFGKERSEEIGPSGFLFFVFFFVGLCCSATFLTLSPCGLRQDRTRQCSHFSRFGSQVRRSAHLLEGEGGGGDPGSNAATGGEGGGQPPAGAVTASRFHFRPCDTSCRARMVSVQRLTQPKGEASGLPVSPVHVSTRSFR